MLKAAIIIIGIGGIVAEIVLLRELLVSFLGNELTVGIILANWLILEAIGSFFLGRSVEKTKRKWEIYVLLGLIFSAALPLAIYFARIFKNMLLATPGEGIGFLPVFYTSFLILLPVSLTHGALFTYSCKLYAELHKEDASAIGKVYVLETIGSIIGGLLITFILIWYFNSFETAFLLALAHTLVSLFLLWPRVSLPWLSLRNGLWLLALVACVLSGYLLFTRQAENIHLASIKSQWQGLQAIHYENSIYGNITITQSGEQFTFYTDGIPSITAPHPDLIFIENFVHFPMLYHEKPEAILVLGGGAGGMINEILKYPVRSVDYVELDPRLLKLVRQYPTPLTESELTDQRVKIHYTDSRFFVKKTQERFDVIFIGLSAPQDLQTNRLFSAEFFSVMKDKLSPNGIVVLSLPGSLTYISPELKNLNGCILDTLKSVYPQVKIIPGEVNLYLASDSAPLDQITTEEIIKRLETRQIETSLFKRGYIEYRLQERWLAWYLQSMSERKVQINSDFRPLGVFFGLSYWNALFSPDFLKYFRWFKEISLTSYITLLVIAILLLVVIFKRKPLVSIYAVPFAIFTSGFANMVLTLAIIFTFQTLYGYLYYQIGLLLTVFMAGVASGSLFITRQLAGINNPARLFLCTELFFIAFAFLLPFVFLLPSPHLEKTFVYVSLYAIFLIMSFLCGALVGLQFPLATKICLSDSSRMTVGHTAGLLYSADLLGGFFGGLLGGVLFLAVLGLKETCVLMALIKMGSLSLFLIFTSTRN